jgi:hypothetical protein
MEVMGLMLGEFVDEYTVRVIDVFAMPQSGNGVASVGDPDPQDPHVFGPPGSGSISQRYGSGSGSRSFPFLKYCLKNRNLTQNFSIKN